MRDSQLVDPYGLEEALGDGNQKSYPRLLPKTKKKIRTRILGKLANFSTTNVESVALSGLEVDFEEIDEKRFNASRSSWLFNLAIFVDYAKKPESSCEVRVFIGQVLFYTSRDSFNAPSASVYQRSTIRQ